MHSSVLRYLVEVARHGSIRKAGAALNIASSGINQRILSLEQELGVQLFIRSPRGMEPTTAGRLLLRHAEQTLNDYDNLRPIIDDVRGLRAGHVRVACEAGLHERIFPHIYRRFIKSHPRVTLSVFQAAPDEVVQLMEHGHVEIGITYSDFMRQNVRKQSEYPAPFGALVAPGHELANQGFATLTECLAFPLVRFGRPGGRDPILDDIIEREAQPVRLSCYTNSLAFAETVVERGGAIAIASSLGFLGAIEDGRLVFVPIVDTPLAEIRLAMFIPGSRYLDAIERKLASAVDAVLLEQATAPIPRSSSPIQDA